jgi:hypothetical protein
MAIECNRNPADTGQTVKFCMVWEVVGHQEPVDNQYWRKSAVSVDNTPVHCTAFYDTIGISRREWVRRAVQIYNHP